MKLFKISIRLDLYWLNILSAFLKIGEIIQNVIIWLSVLLSSNHPWHFHLLMSSLWSLVQPSSNHSSRLRPPSIVDHHLLLPPTYVSQITFCIEYGLLYIQSIPTWSYFLIILHSKFKVISNFHLGFEGNV